MLAGLAACGAQAAELKVERLAVPGDIKRIESEGRRVVVVNWQDKRFRITGEIGGRRLQPVGEAPPLVVLPTGALPDAVVARGERNIQAAWLADPTTRYSHGVIGDRIEAGALVARLPDGTQTRLSLPADSVFEDRMARIVDADGDGEDEILVVHSYLDRGAALALVALVDGSLKIVAETPPIGQANRWLNPVGVGDFDGDRRPEIAYVETPHIGGILHLYRYQGGRLERIASRQGFANHAVGSFQLDLSLIMDVNADGIVDLILPDATRTRLRVMTAAGGELRELAAIDLGRRIAFGFHRLAPGEFVLGLTGGEIAVVSVKL